MKRLLLCLLLLLALSTTALAEAANLAGSGQTVTIRKAGDVNVRSEPSFNGKKVGQARANRTYPLLEIAENGWYKIQLNDGVEGYISSKLVKGEPQSTTSQRVLIRKSGNANVRSSPQANAKRVAVARANRAYPLLETDAETGWYKILAPGGVIGYVSPKLVDHVIDPEAAKETAPQAAASSSAAEAEPENTVTIRKGGNVNVRAEASSSGKKVGTASAGRKYELLETTESGWYKIRLKNGVEGYISGKLAK